MPETQSPAISLGLLSQREYAFKILVASIKYPFIMVVPIYTALSGVYEPLHPNNLAFTEHRQTFTSLYFLFVLLFMVGIKSKA